MTAIYTWDASSTVDGFASYGEDGDWGGYWGKQGPEFLDRRLDLLRTGAADGAGRDHPGIPGGAGPRSGSTQESQGGDSGEHADAEPADDGGVLDPARYRSSGRTRPSRAG